MLKTCHKCTRELPITEFFKNKTKPGGLDSWCKECNVANAKAWKERPGNRETFNGYTHKYRSNPEIRAKNKEQTLGYRRSIRGKAVMMYGRAKERVRSRTPYIGLKFDFDLNSFVDWALSNQNYLKLHTAWVNSGYEGELCPTIDRIDNLAGYTFENIQILTKRDNRIKQHEDFKKGKSLRKKKLPC